MTDSATNNVGTVVGICSTVEFQMQVRPDAIRAQDLVAVDTHEDGRTFRVWAKVATIERLNPLFPKEAAQELAYSGREPADTVISMSREMITATCTVVGVERNGRLEPPKYPVQPASRVYVPPSAEVEAFLAGDIPEHQRLHLGHERGNQRVRVFVNGHAIVSRHLAVLASTGAGKTVATRKLLEELVRVRYPILIFDPHGDYAGLNNLPGSDVTTYLPEIGLAEEDTERVISYLSGLAGRPPTEAQGELIAACVEVLRDATKHEALDNALQQLGQPPLAKTLENDHFYAIAEIADRVAILRAGDDRAPIPREVSRVEIGLSRGNASTASVSRSLAKRAGWQYWNMMKTNRKFSAGAKRLPPSKRLHEILGPGKVATVALEGYSDELRQSIVASIMQQLLIDRIDERVPRFLTVLEEAHNFIPGWNAGGASAGEAPSLPILKQIATEGRKYGMGLVMISQRPSRVDQTVLSQANSFLILRIVNPNDQRFIRDVVESLGEAEARALPSLNTGEALTSGQFTRIPVMVKVQKSDTEGKREEEDFFDYMTNKPDPRTSEIPDNVAEARKTHPRAYEPWTRDEESRLVERFTNGARVTEIAAEFQRQPAAIRSRLTKLGYEVQ